MRIFVFQISDGRPQSRPIGTRESGFTLVEILVVLLIVTLLAGVTIARLPAAVQAADLERESQRIELLLNMARNEAVLDSVEYGLKPTLRGYEFLRFDEGSQDWVRAEAPFHARELPEPLKLELRTNKDGLSNLSGLGDGLPPVLILSSGETTPFTLTLRGASRDAERVLSTDGYSEIQHQSKDD